MKKRQSNLNLKIALALTKYDEDLITLNGAINDIISVKKLSDKEIKKMALEMIYQMTGERVPEEKQCIVQGDADYQIAMHYLEKVNNSTT